MTMQFKTVVLLVAFGLNGCAHAPSSMIPLDGSPVDDLSRVAQVVEDPDHPLLLRGLDRMPLDTMRVPNAFSKYVYLMRAGQHIFWVMNMPYGHPLVPQRVRCYVMEAAVAQGARYRLREHADAKTALLLDDDTGRTVAIGRLVDEPWIFSRSCQWQ